MSLIRVAALVVWIALIAPVTQAADWKFSVSFSSQIRTEPFTGHVLVLLSKRNPEPRQGPNWFHPEVFCSQEVKQWKPDTPVFFDPSAPTNIRWYPEPFNQLDLSGYRVQAVARFNPQVREIGRGPGNGFSQVATITASGEQPTLVIKDIVPEPHYQDTKWSKLLRVKSTLLTQFYGHDVYQQAAVLLPASYHDQPERRYPVLFQIPGFGGDHHSAVLRDPITETNNLGIEFIRVMLDPSCPLGHHVFADSANNGPRGQALIDEFIPEFDRQYRSIAKPAARLVTGHSSGGWSSLWLQVTYPDHFGGVWSTSPDPVDFRDFQNINLYRAGENMYVDSASKERPIARVNGQVVLWYRGFDRMEWTLGPGGQLHSFEAAFSPRGADGKPVLVWDRQTGAVHTDAAKHWEKYDIRLVLERNWKTLGPKLKGKLRVHMGDQDTFYLEGATVLLKQSLKDLGSDAVVEIHTGRDHSNILSPDFRNRIRQEMAEQVRSIVLPAQ